MCSTEEWEKYLDIKEGSGLELWMKTLPSSVWTGVLETGWWTYEGDGDTQEGMLNAPRAAWGWQETEMGKNSFLIAVIR